MNDIANQDTSLDKVERSMGDREIAEGSARTAVLRRRYDAPIQDVWDAITTPERIDRFFLPVSGDLRAGGIYSLQGQASGEILACAAPTLLRLEWTPPDDRRVPQRPGHGLLRRGHGMGRAVALPRRIPARSPPRPPGVRVVHLRRSRRDAARRAPRGRAWAKVEASHARSAGSN